MISSIAACGFAPQASVVDAHDPLVDAASKDARPDGQPPLDAHMDAPSTTPFDLASSWNKTVGCRLVQIFRWKTLTQF